MKLAVRLYPSKKSGKWIRVHGYVDPKDNSIEDMYEPARHNEFIEKYGVEIYNKVMASKEFYYETYEL